MLIALIWTLDRHQNFTYELPLEVITPVVSLLYRMIRSKMFKYELISLTEMLERTKEGNRGQCEERG